MILKNPLNQGADPPHCIPPATCWGATPTRALPSAETVLTRAQKPEGWGEVIPCSQSQMPRAKGCLYNPSIIFLFDGFLISGFGHNGTSGSLSAKRSGWLISMLRCSLTPWRHCLHRASWITVRSSAMSAAGLRQFCHSFLLPSNSVCTIFLSGDHQIVR